MRAFCLEFIGRSGCHLCDEAEPLVRRWARRLRADLAIRDVGGDPDLAAAYGRRIPVVLGPGGRVLAEGRIEPAPFIRALLRERLRALAGGG